MSASALPPEKPELVIVCASCFPGLNRINDFRISHGCCAFHFWAKVFEYHMLCAIDDGEIPCVHDQGSYKSVL